VGVDVLSRAGQLVLGLLDAGWPLLLAAVGLGLGLSSRRGRAAVRWLQRRLTTRPVRWSAAAAGLLVVLVLVGVLLPPRFTAHRHFDKAADELKAQNDVRTTLLQALAGGVLLLGAYFTWRQLRVTHEGQITDRYTKAVDQLGHDVLDVRLGGIYALERIARDSPPDRAPIEEVLTAFVRGPRPLAGPAISPLPAGDHPTADHLCAGARSGTAMAENHRHRRPGSTRQTQRGGAEPQGPPADMQAAVTVLGRRQRPSDGLRPLDLTRVNLRGAELTRANMKGAWLTHTNLKDAQLGGANLQGAHLQGAHLQDA
jgi:Pentapeptide repeats (8 copies)